MTLLLGTKTMRVFLFFYLQDVNVNMITELYKWAAMTPLDWLSRIQLNKLN